MSSAFGSSEGVASGAGLALAAAVLAFFFAAFGLLCAFGVTRNTLAAISSAHEKYFFRLVMRIQLGGRLWNHAALEHFVGDRSGNLVDESRAHLRIGFQHLESLLLHLRFRSLALLGSLLPQLFASGRLVFL